MAHKQRKDSNTGSSPLTAEEIEKTYPLYHQLSGRDKAELRELVVVSTERGNRVRKIRFGDYEYDGETETWWYVG